MNVLVSPSSSPTSTPQPSCTGGLAVAVSLPPRDAAPANDRGALAAVLQLHEPSHLREEEGGRLR